MHRWLETEIKLEVRSMSRMRRRLAGLGFVVLRKRSLERNVLLDTADSRLRKASCLLRLRSVSGRKLVTLKAAPRPAGRFKVRPEWEAEIRNAATLRSVLKSLGLRRAFRYEKFRTTYAAAGRLLEGLVELDETPIGNYLELEGPQNWIDRTARTLGYTKADYITASYGKLYKSHCLARRIRARDMVFTRRKT